MNKTVALITGGTSGIGLACAEIFSKTNTNIIISGRDKQKGLRAIKKLQNQNVEFYQCDISKSSEIDKLFQYIKKNYGALHIAINNAATSGDIKEFHEQSLDNWQKLLDTNVTSVVLCMQKEIILMRQQQYGRIINISSIAGIRAGNAGAMYTATKHAIVGLTRSTARENAPHGITINVICPGFIATPMLEEVAGDYQEHIAKIPLQRYGKPEEIAGCVKWLIDDSGAFTTGSIITIDGGITA